MKSFLSRFATEWPLGCSAVVIPEAQRKWDRAHQPYPETSGGVWTIFPGAVPAGAGAVHSFRRPRRALPAVDPRARV
jgi:hypothetical protein